VGGFVGRAQIGRAALATASALFTLGAVSCSATPPFALPRDKAATHDKDLAPPAEASTCGTGKCLPADALLAAAQAFSHIRHDLLLETASAMEPGRGIEKLASGGFAQVGISCARPRASAAQSAAAQNAAAPGREIDFRYVGLVLDSMLVGADVDLATYFSAGGSLKKRRLKLVALALVRDEDPQFYEATSDVVPSPAGGDGGCACGRATHFVGAVKYGAMVSYETEVTDAEAHGSAMGLLEARIEKGDARVTKTTVGELSLEGLSSEAGPSQLRFEVEKAVPIAYALYPVADVCKFALPEPEVSPLPVDLGVVPFGAQASRQVRVVNRAGLDVVASHGGDEVTIPAFGSANLSFAWSPEGEGARCEAKEREEEIVLRPKDARLSVTPKERRVPVPLHVVAGMPTFSKHEPVDTGASRSPDYEKTSLDWSCPAGYALESCEAQLERCASSNGTCHVDGYRLSADEVDGKGCRFRCSGPSSTLFGDHRCSYTAAMTCRLSCR